VLHEPLLDLSLSFKTHRSRYDELLQKVRLEGVWEEWLEFFLEGIIFTAAQAAETAAKLRQLFCEDSARAQSFGKASGTAALASVIAKATRSAPFGISLLESPKRWRPLLMLCRTSSNWAT
jgi:Fic family protein